ncbi:hypothetical protein KKB18_10905 [bacterium]|nr:hypothetical protein [bacterium]
MDEKVKFIIDVNRNGTIRLKYTYQERYRSSIILVRLDINGSPHTNPPDSLAPLNLLEPYFGEKN